VFTGGRAAVLYRRIVVSNHESDFDTYNQDLRRLAASANASDTAVDARVFLIKDLPRSRGRCGNIGSTRLAVTDRR
jgi:hypothetical protein